MENDKPKAAPIIAGWIIVMLCAFAATYFNSLLPLGIALPFLYVGIAKAFRYSHYQQAETYSEYVQSTSQTPESILADKISQMSEAQINVYRDVIQTHNFAKAEGLHPIDKL